MREIAESWSCSDVLVLLDSLSLLPGRVPARFFKQNQFSWFSNSPEPLNFSDEDLEEWLEALRHEDVLVASVDGDEKCYEIGKVGREIWESSRKPRWELFVNPSSPSWVGDNECVLSLDEELGREYLRVASRAGVFALAGEFEHQLVEFTLLAPQLLMKNVHQFTFRQSEGKLGSSVDWVEYERCRIWWSTVMDLKKSAWARR